MKEETIKSQFIVNKHIQTYIRMLPISELLIENTLLTRRPQQSILQMDALVSFCTRGVWLRTRGSCQHQTPCKRHNGPPIMTWRDEPRSPTTQTNDQTKLPGKWKPIGSTCWMGGPIETLELRMPILCRNEFANSMWEENTIWVNIWSILNAGYQEPSRSIHACDCMRVLTAISSCIWFSKLRLPLGLDKQHIALPQPSRSRSTSPPLLWCRHLAVAGAIKGIPWATSQFDGENESRNMSNICNKYVKTLCFAGVASIFHLPMAASHPLRSLQYSPQYAAQRFLQHRITWHNRLSLDLSKSPKIHNKHTKKSRYSRYSRHTKKTVQTRTGS